MAAEVVREKGKILGAAMAMASILEKEVGPKEKPKKRSANTLKDRLAQLQEEIVREATIREAQTHNSSELHVLTTSIKHLERSGNVKDNDLLTSISILKERIEHVKRKATYIEEQLELQMLKEENARCDQIGKSEEEDDNSLKSCDNKHHIQSVRCRGELMTRTHFWEKLRSKAGTIEQNPSLDVDDFSNIDINYVTLLKEQIRSRGFFKIDNDAVIQNNKRKAELIPSSILASISNSMDTLREHGFPPIFLFMFNETWKALSITWSIAERIMGSTCVLEPSFAAYHLQNISSQSRYIGTNFGIPHRDYSYADSVLSDGSTKVLSLWIAINDVTLDNGCMYVVPKEYDENFDRDDAYEHMQVCSTGELKDKKFLNFPLHCILPLPCKSGSILGWQGNVIHWGSACQDVGTSNPRKSIAFVFRRADAVHHHDIKGLRRHEIDSFIKNNGVEMEGLCDTSIGNDDCVQNKLSKIMDAIAFFKHWYDVPTSLLESLRVAKAIIDQNNKE